MRRTVTTVVSAIIAAACASTPGAKPHDMSAAQHERMAAGEQDPKTPAEHFFRELKRSTVRAYYSSKIGIHADQEYKGNVYQRGEFAGFDAK